jgi:hypothetical protein
MTMKNSSASFGNQILDLPACSAVPQPTAPPRVPYLRSRDQNYESYADLHIAAFFDVTPYILAHGYHHLVGKFLPKLTGQRLK